MSNKDELILNPDPGSVPESEESDTEHDLNGVDSDSSESELENESDDELGILDSDDLESVEPEDESNESEDESNETEDEPDR